MRRQVSARARTNRGMRRDRARRLAWGPTSVPQSSPGARHVLPQGQTSQPVQSGVVCATTFISQPIRQIGKSNRAQQKSNPRAWEQTRGYEPVSCQYIRGQKSWFGALPSNGAQIGRRGLPSLAIGNNLESDFLSLVEAVQAGAFDRADVDKDILAAIIRLDKAEALLAVEPLHGSLRHVTFLSGVCN